MTSIQRPGLRDARSTASVFTQLCSLCATHRLSGSLLAFRQGTGGMGWVCEDCQHQLARRVDDEGTLGG